MKYRKKPVVIEAMRFDGTNYRALRVFTDNDFCMVAPEDRTDDPECIAEVYDKLHSTWIGVKAGQWIIRGLKGEFYPCDPQVFENTYEVAE